MANESNPTNTDAQQPGNPINAGTFDSQNNSKFADVQNDLDSLLNSNPKGLNNPLNKYKTYNYLFTLAVIPPEMANSGNYPSPGNMPNILVRSQGDWGNADRVQTEFGAYDYYLDNLIINTQHMLTENTGATVNQTAIAFEITEPYSMGLFYESIVVGGYSAGYKNPQENTYVLCIEFAGYQDDDAPMIDHSLTKYITFHINDIRMSVTNAGSKYQITGTPFTQKTFEDTSSTIPVDMKVYGKTVEDFLSKSAPGSLVYALNRMLQQLKTDKSLQTTDRYEINFPSNPNAPGTTNRIGKAVLFKDVNSAGSQPQPGPKKIYDAANKIYKDNNLNVEEDRVMNIPRNNSIMSAIKEAILRSDYISSQLDGGEFQTDANGMMDWFIIKPRNLFGDHNSQLNRRNRVWIYDVIPWKVQVHKFLPPGAAPVGYDNLKNQVAKVYDYIYTGKNTEVLVWDIKFDNLFGDLQPLDLTTNTGTSISGLVGDGDVSQLGKALADVVNFGAKEMMSKVFLHGDGKRLFGAGVGSGTDRSSSLNARIMNKILENNADMNTLNMTIKGDPYWLGNQETGNTVVGAQQQFLNTQNAVNTYGGQLMVVVNFRTPIDLDPVTGNYKFTATLDTVSGLYQVSNIVSRFEKGRFTQQFNNCIRLRMQTVTSGNSKFGIQSGQQGQGGYLAAGNTDILGAALGGLLGGGLFGKGIPVPNIGGILSGAVGGVVDEITSAVGDLAGDVSSVTDNLLDE
jgi:hypothetical protein